MGKVRKYRAKSAANANHEKSGASTSPAEKKLFATSTGRASSRKSDATSSPESVPVPQPPPAKGKAKAKTANTAKAVTPQKRAYDSDTNNNANAKTGPAKRVRTQRKPYQAEDPIPKKLLNQLLAADNKRPSTTGKPLGSKPAGSSKPMASAASSSSGTSSKQDKTKGKATPKPTEKTGSKTKATATTKKPADEVDKVAPKRASAKVSLPVKKRLSMSTSSLNSTTTVSKSKVRMTSFTVTQTNSVVSTSTSKTSAKTRKPPSVPVPTPSPKPELDDRPPFTTSTEIIPPRKRKSSAKPVLNQVSASSKKISKKKLQNSEPTANAAAKSAKTRSKKQKLVPVSLIDMMESPPTLPINAIAWPLKKRKKLPSLVPRPQVTEYEVDPTFDSELPMPFISTFVQSKLLIRAVRTGNLAQLEALIKDPERICTFNLPRSLTNSENAFVAAVKASNTKAMKLVLYTAKIADKLGPYPDLLLQSESTGTPSYRMFGHAMRNVSVARGSKEGNDALLKDQSLYRNKSKNLTLYEASTALMQHALEKGLSWNEITKLMEAIDHDGQESFKQNAPYKMYDAVYRGHIELAAELTEMGLTRGGYGFNQLHKEALSLSGGKPFTPFKSISVTKKAINRVTPVHCAAINPDPYYIKILLGVRQEYNVLDLFGRSPIHFAAANSKPAVLEFLISQGISVLLADKEGKTPLYIAAELDRVENVSAIIKSQQQLETGDAHNVSTDFNKDPLINRPNLKNGLSPIHIAAEKGHYAVVNALLDLGATPNRALSAQYDKLTPAMIAAKHGHLDILKLLIDKGEINIEEGDKRGKTALAYAVIEGQGHIVSYLLRLGVNNKVKDTSGNTLAHYAAAYGWYFIWNLLIEAGCDPNEANDWKMTPVGIAFLKGHMGLVEVILNQPGIDINAPIDDTTGQNLLHQTCSQLSSSFTAKLKFLIERQGADCNAVDMEKNNALGFLVSVEAKELVKRMYCYEWVRKELVQSPKHKKFGIKENPMLSALMSQESYSTEYSYEELVKNRQAIHDAVLLLLKHGCNPNAMNTHSVSPISLAYLTGCTELVSLLLENGFGVTSIHVTREGDTILHSLVKLICSSRPTAYRMQIKDFLRNCLAKDPAAFKLYRDMCRMPNKDGLTPLHHLLQNFTDATLLENATLKAVNNYYEETLSLLVSDLNSDVNAVTANKAKDSPLHLAVQRGTFSIESIEQLLSKGPDLDSLNHEQKTPLVVAIENKREAAAKFLIQSGANVNFVSRRHQNKSILILAAENFCNEFNIISSLTQKNVLLNSFDNKTGNSVLHLLAMKPNVPNVANAFKKLIAAGCDVMKENVHGQTPLHMVVNERAGETDVSYDLEELIIEANPKSLIQQDGKGRIPLHYAFVKQSKVAKTEDPFAPAPDKPFAKIDPIELVALFTRSMKDSVTSSPSPSSQSIFVKDVHGATLLHYAAQCGSIICISLLISELKTSMSRASIDELDENGNTAFALAVWKGNDGAALQFQQNGADFLCPLNTYQQRKEHRAHEFEWRHIAQVRAETQRELKLILKYPILQEVISQNHQGILHLMLEKLNMTGNGHGIINAVEAALKTKRFKLALKLLHRVKSFSTSLQSKSAGTLFHVMGKISDATQQVEVVQSLISKNVSLQALDEFGANAIIYAAINWNTELCQEFTRVLGLEEVSRMRPDHFRRTPFSALFWKLVKKSGQSMPDEIKKWAEDLLRSGASPNVHTSYPIVLSTSPGIGYLLVDDNKNNHNTLTTPLIMAVLSRNYDVVKWLLSLGTSAGEAKMMIELDAQDELGRTALMHAVKLNDIKMVKLLLNHRDYDEKLDTRPWYESSRKKKKNAKGNTFTAICSPSLLKIADAKGWTVLHHLASPLLSSAGPLCFTNSFRILQVLASSMGLEGLASLDVRTRSAIQAALEVAKSTSKYHPIIEQLEQILRISGLQKSKITPSYEFVRISGADNFGPELAEAVVNDAVLSSREILRKVQGCESAGMDVDGAEHNSVKFQLKPDPLAGLKKGHAVIIQDTTQDNLPFDVLLTQVDLAYGQYGLYNFYKMQLIKQTKGKGLILLFTRWGRVGDEGQYQKTPFPDEETAIKEFKKIFRAKTGNNWEALDQFKPLAKKYRLVNVDRRKTSKDQLSKVKVDFGVIEKAEKKIRSKIGDEKVISLMKKLCLVHQKAETKRKEQNDSDGDEDEESRFDVGPTETETEDQALVVDEEGAGATTRMLLPVLQRRQTADGDGIVQSSSSSEDEDPVEEEEESDDYTEGSALSLALLNKETLEKGNEILNEISKLVQQKGQMQNTRSADTSNNEEYVEIYNSLIKLSEEYFSLIPVRGFSFERIEPVFDVGKLRETQLQIHHLVHLEYATKTLLASQLRANTINPYDYVYKSLNTKIEIMDPNTDESQLILQYIHNTGGRKPPTVEAVYRVERHDEMRALQETGIDNRWLLWHGTETKNILSILHSGLQAVPLGARLSGSAFGKGIYFADMFEKSTHFCFNDGSIKDSSKFMLLCEVALGKIQDVNVNRIYGSNYDAVDPEYNSFKTCDSQYEPDPGTTIFWNGRHVPLGPKTQYILEPRENENDPYLYYGLDFNEYVVFNPNQVCLRYLVQFHD